MNATAEDNVLREGDVTFLGVNQRLAPDKLAPGLVSDARNCRFREGRPVTRGGVTVRWIGPEADPRSPYAMPAGGAIYRTDDGQEWIITASGNKVYRAKTHQAGTEIPLPAGTTLPNRVEFTQAGKNLYLWRGFDLEPLELTDGDFATGFTAVTQTTSGSGNGTGTLTIPNGKQAIYYQERLWVVGRDSDGNEGIFISDVLNFTRYSLRNQFRIESGSEDALLAVYPFGNNAIIAFKSRSVHSRFNLIPDNSGDLTTAQGEVLSNTHGLVSPYAVTQAGKDIFYFSTNGLTSVRLSEEGRLKGTDLPLDQDMQALWRRINWKAVGNSALATWDSKLYWTLPVDGSQVCNAVAVYDLQTQTWQGTDEGVPFEQGVVTFIRPDYCGQLRLWFLDGRGYWRIYEEGDVDVRIGSYLLASGTGARLLSSLGTPLMSSDNGWNAVPITTTVLTRGYTCGSVRPKRFNRIECSVATRNPNLAIQARFSPEASRTQLLFPNYTTSRTRRRLAFQAAWDASNVNDDFNSDGREDYTLVLPAGGMQLKSGVYLNRFQERQFIGRAGGQARFVQVQFTNTTGTINVNSVEVEGYLGNSRGGK